MSDPIKCPTKCLARFDETTECELRAGHSGPHSVSYDGKTAKRWLPDDLYVSVVSSSAVPRYQMTRGQLVARVMLAWREAGNLTPDLADAEVAVDVLYGPFNR